MKRTVIYGKGKFYNDFRSEVEQFGEIVAYVDSNGENTDKKTYKRIDDVNEEYDNVLIMVSRIAICFEIIDILIRAGIEYKSIILGIEKWGEYSSLDRIEVTKSGKILLSKNDIDIEVNNEDEFQNVIDTILKECYKYSLRGNKKEVVFDVGMNVGDATVYFAKMQKVIAVYSFEPFQKTFQDAQKNVSLNFMDDKTYLYNFGLSDHEEKMDILYNGDMSCGQSTRSENIEKAYKSYEKLDLIDKSKSEIETIEVKKASSIFSELIYKYSDKEVIFVLKLDCEGEEFAIISDLDQMGLLQSFSFIMLEWHYLPENSIIDSLEKKGFSFFSIKKSINPYLGLLYAWK